MALGHSLLEEFIARSSVSYHNYYVIIARICCSAMFFVRSVCSVGWLANLAWPPHARGGGPGGLAAGRAPRGDDALKKGTPIGTTVLFSSLTWKVEM